MEPGEKWAYRARKNDPLVEVEVLKSGKKKPTRVSVRFVDDSFEGRREWVSPARLKTPWEHASVFESREKRWDAVMSPGLPRDDPREYATEIVFDQLIAGELASFDGASRGGIVTVADVDGLAAFLSVTADQLSSHPAAFVEDGELIAPWETTELVASTAARNDPQPIQLWVDSEERRASREAIHGRHLDARTSYFIEPEDCFEFDEKHGRPARTLLRQWCDADPTARFDELAALRNEIRRVDGIAREAIEFLARSNAGTAMRLRAALRG